MNKTEKKSLNYVFRKKMKKVKNELGGNFVVDFYSNNYWKARPFYKSIRLCCMNG